MLRCRHSHIYKLCQLLKHGNSVEVVVFEMWEKNLRSLKMWETLLPRLMSGLESDSLHAMHILHALPATYEIVQQMILANVSNYKTLKFADMRSCLLSEELHQGTTASVNAIRTGKKMGKDMNCNHCGGSNHWEKGCFCKQREHSREEVQSKQKKGN